jgi:hypothetical protein
MPFDPHRWPNAMTIADLIERGLRMCTAIRAAGMSWLIRQRCLSPPSCRFHRSKDGSIARETLQMHSLRLALDGGAAGMAESLSALKFATQIATQRLSTGRDGKGLSLASSRKIPAISG